jgi:hypothetical protein
VAGTVSIELENGIGPARVGQLVDLYASTWRAAGRTRADLERMLAGCDLLLALVDRSADRLVGFARVLTDDAHPAAVESLELVCRPGLVPLHRRWGFTDDVGAARLMRCARHGAQGPARVGAQRSLARATRGPHTFAIVRRRGSGRPVAGHNLRRRGS